MADLANLSLSDFAAAIKERCSTPQDLQILQSKLDAMAGQACVDAGMAARDASNIREEVQENRSALYNRIGQSERYASQNKDALSAEHAVLGNAIADTKFQIHDNVVKGFGNTDRAILAGDMDINRTLANMARDQAACCCEIRTEGLKNTHHLERQIERSERWHERELRDFRAEQALAFAAVAKAQAECCCETKLLIKDTAFEASKEATANYTSLTAQIAALSREMEKSFCALNTKDLERDLADKQLALAKAQAEISNRNQTDVIIAALSKGKS